MKTKNEIKQTLNEWFEKVMETAVELMIKWFHFMNGDFGRHGKFINEARGRWQMITWTIFSVLFFKCIMFPIFEWWDGVVQWINYVRWGC